jgi:hypothetical protein
VSEARGITDHDADASTAFSAGAQLLDAPLVQHRRGRRAVLDEDFSELAAAGHRLAQRSLEDVVFNQCRIHSRERTREKWRRNVTSDPRN